MSLTPTLAATAEWLFLAPYRARNVAEAAGPSTQSMEAQDMITRLAVVNRGEPALRLIRAVRQLNEEGRHGITVITMHTQAEQRALFVRAADESVCLRDDASSGNPYLDHGELERALRVIRADSVWVGWGFVAEDPAFADLCERLGLVFIGPPAKAMRQLGDKIEAKLLAEQTGVPVAPWSGRRHVVSDADEGRQAQIRVEFAELRTTVRSEKLGEVAEEFEQVHNIERARTVGSVDAIIPASELRPSLVGAVERGMRRARRDDPDASAT